VASGGTASGVIFSSGGTLQLDSASHLSGTISGFHLGEAIDLRGLAFSSSGSTLSWTQKTSGANASGMLTVKEGTSSMSFTLVGSYTSGNFSATSDGHGGTLITDPPITGGAVVTSSGTGSGSEGIAGAPGSDTTVHSGGYEFGRGAGPSGGGGVISGFDLGDEIGPPQPGIWIVIRRHVVDARGPLGRSRFTGRRQGREHLQPRPARAVCSGQFDRVILDDPHNVIQA
jgi:hypothetical protein